VSSLPATERHLPFPYGRETTGYVVDDLVATLMKAAKAQRAAK
jgi:hypothetical protein